VIPLSAGGASDDMLNSPRTRPRISSGALSWTSGHP